MQDNSSPQHSQTWGFAPYSPDLSAVAPASPAVVDQLRRDGLAAAVLAADEEQAAVSDARITSALSSFAKTRRGRRRARLGKLLPSPDTSALDDAISTVNPPSVNKGVLSPAPDGAALWRIGLDTAKIRVFGAPTLDENRAPFMGALGRALKCSVDSKNRRGAAAVCTDALSSFFHLTPTAGIHASRMAREAGPNEELADMVRLPVDDFLHGLSVPPSGAYGDCVDVPGTDIALRVQEGFKSWRISAENSQLGLQVDFFSKLQNMGAICVRFGARWWTSRGYDDALEFCATLAEACGLSNVDAQLSQLDIKCDIDRAVSSRLWNEKRPRWRGRARGVHPRVDGNGNFTGYTNQTPGNGGKKANRKPKKVRFTAYDRRLAEKNDPFWSAHWRELGIPADLPLWRFEFKVTREELTAHGIDKPSHLTVDRLRSLWAYCTSEYVYLATRATAGEKNKERIDVAPLWRRVQSAAGRLRAPDREPVKRGLSVEYSHTMATAVGSVRTTVARAGALHTSALAAELVEDVMRQAEWFADDVMDVCGTMLIRFGVHLRQNRHDFRPGELLDALQVQMLEALEAEKTSLGADYAPAFRPESWWREREELPLSEPLPLPSDLSL